MQPSTILPVNKRQANHSRHYRNARHREEGKPARVASLPPNRIAFSLWDCTIPRYYFNSGVLVPDLELIRAEKMEDRFLPIIEAYYE